MLNSVPISLSFEVKTNVVWHLFFSDLPLNIPKMFLFVHRICKVIQDNRILLIVVPSLSTVLPHSSLGNLFKTISSTTLIVQFIMQELDHVVEELEKIAVVHLLQHRSIISLIGNVQRSSLILEKVFLF